MNIFVKNFNLPESWQNALGSRFCEEIIADLELRINELINNGAKIFPSIDRIFNALLLTPFSETKVVILGQDPYHQFGQAEIYLILSFFWLYGRLLQIYVTHLLFFEEKTKLDHFLKI